MPFSVDTFLSADHFFGIGLLEDRFPGGKAVATAEVVKGSITVLR